VPTKLLKASFIDSESALRRAFLKFVDVRLYCFIAFLKLVGLSQISELASEPFDVEASLPNGNNKGISSDHLT
jgi:hypothetical protein